MIFSILSGLTLLSLPAEVYKYGLALALMVPVNIIIALATYYLFLPVFYKLQVTSMYEYLNIRFNNAVRLFASFLFALNMMFYLPIVIYLPALALGQGKVFLENIFHPSIWLLLLVTNLNVHVITPIVCGVCIFYTTLGGLRAVVWTDVIQFGVMVGSLVAVVAVGIWHGGGFTTILEKSNRGGQLNIRYLHVF